MAGILDEVAQAVGAVAANAAPPAPAQAAPADPSVWPLPASVPATSVEDRLSALEDFAVKWGPVIEKLAPMLEKLANL